MPAVDPRVETTIEHFNTLYLAGIPPTITDASAFLSFICVLTATEALAGFRFPNQSEGARFRAFVRAYFPTPYHPLADRLWRFRCRMVHSFSPAGFFLTHHHSEQHLRPTYDDRPVLNAEDFYTALVVAAESYFANLRDDADLQALMIARLDDSQGGPIAVGPIPFAR